MIGKLVVLCVVVIVVNGQVVPDKPTITRAYPQHLAQVEGSQASAFCSAHSSSPFSLTWRAFTSGNKLSKNAKMLEKSNDTGGIYFRQNIIIFQKLSPEDVGTYACVARNAVGSTTSIIEVAIKVHGGWGSWSGYNDCNKQCGGGIQRRSRSCDQPAPENEGLACMMNDGNGGFSETESRGCNVAPCVVNCEDKSRYCKQYVDDGDCVNRKWYMKIVCCRSCKDLQDRVSVKAPEPEPEPTEPPELNTVECKSDIGYIVDASATLNREFNRSKKFVKTLARIFGVSRDGSRGSVVTFSYDATHRIKFNDHFNLNSFNDAVERLPVVGSITRIDIALRLAQMKMFKRENGARRGFNKVLVLLTDGSQTKRRGAEDPARIAQELREKGVNIIVIGLGDEINPVQLNRMAGSADKLFYAGGFNEFTDRQKIIKASCLIDPPRICDDSSTMDVGFLIDASGSVVHQFEAEKNFLKNLVATFGVGRDKTRVGVVTFSYHTKHNIKLNAYHDLFSFNAAVDNIDLMGSTTYIDKGLRLTQREMFKPENGGRKGVHKLLIVMTDGSQTPHGGSENPGDIAKELRDEGINVVVIGIVGDINHMMLKRIAGPKGKVFNVGSIKELSARRFTQRVVAATSLCKPGSTKFLDLLPPIYTVCEDAFDVCSQWAERCNNYSADWTKYMKRNCRYTCRICV